MKSKSSSFTDILYWLTILSACAMGETGADFLSHGPMNLGYGLASLILGSLVVFVLYLELKAKIPNQARYWTAIVIMSTAGTTMADFLSRSLELGYFWSTALLITVFVVTLVFWHKGKKPVGKKGSILPHVDVNSETKGATLPHIEIRKSARNLPNTDSRYWAAIMVASTLGTTLGDYCSNGTKLGFGGSTILLSTLLLIVLFVERRAKLANETRYWTALIIASTIGATSGDYLTKEEGLDMGYLWGNLSLIILFVSIIFVGQKLTRK